MRTLVLGGYGNFGARICRALAADAGIRLLVGGRDLDRARALAHELGAGAQGVAVDLAAPGFPDALRRLGIELLIHTAGPFQQQSYGTALAAALGFARNMPHWVRSTDAGRWEPRREGRLPADIEGSRALVIGFGAVGQTLARLAAALGMRVTAVRRTQPGPSGGIVDESALNLALREGRLASTFSDVFATEPLPPASPLWTAPGMIVSAHSAGPSAGFHQRTVDCFLSNLQRHDDGAPLLNRVED